MKARKSDLLAGALLIAAAVLFLLFQALPISSRKVSDNHWLAEHGYVVWSEMGEMLSRPGRLDMESGLITAGILMGTALAMASPFLIGILSRSRLLWWVAVLASALVFCGVTGVVGWNLMDSFHDPTVFRWKSGMACLVLWPLLHFVGVLCIRKREPEQPAATDPRGFGAE